MSETWERGFRIDDMASACAFVSSLWSDEREAPIRLHERGVEDDGAPKWSRGFYHYVAGSPDEVYEAVETVSCRNRSFDCLRCHGDGVYESRYLRYRYPLQRALAILGRRQHDQWTKDVPRRPFHPSPRHVLIVMASVSFDPERIRLTYKDGTTVPREMAELFVVGAARKIRGAYRVTYVPRHELSYSQLAAEDAA